MQPTLNFNITDKNWQKNDQTIIETAIKTLFEQIELKTPKICEVEISISLSDNNFIQSLNKQYRNIDKPTNTLSFPLSKIDINQQHYQEFLPLGDIILAYGQIHNEAKTQTKTFHNHLSHLTIHSTLHLLGFDHQNEIEASIMENLEIKILKKLDIDNPYMLQ